MDSFKIKDKLPLNVTPILTTQQQNRLFLFVIVPLQLCYMMYLNSKYVLSCPKYVVVVVII